MGDTDIEYDVVCVNYMGHLPYVHVILDEGMLL